MYLMHYSKLHQLNHILISCFSFSFILFYFYFLFFIFIFFFLRVGLTFCVKDLLGSNHMNFEALFSWKILKKIF